MSKAFEFDYNSVIQSAAKDMSLNVSTMSENKRDQSISSGLLCNDLIIGNAGWISGWHTSAGFEQSAKCLRGDTLVNTNQGFITLEEAIGEIGHNPISDLSIVTKDGIENVSHTFCQEVEVTHKIITQSGVVLQGTPIHPMLVLSSNLEFEWKKMTDLTDQDWIVASGSKSKPLFGNNNLDIYEARELGHFSCTSSAKYKSIPLSVRTSSQEVIHAFLESYFDHVSEYESEHIKLSSTSNELTSQIKTLLYVIYGIRSFYKTIESDSSSLSNTRIHQLLISGKDAIEFISTFSNKKIAKYKDSFEVNTHSKDVYQDIPFLNDQMKDNKERLKTIIDAGYTFDRVVSNDRIEKNMKVYDVTVPGSHSFIANGLVSHNTSTAILGLHSAYKSRVPLKHIWDYEHTFDPMYFDNFWDTDVEDDVFGKRKDTGDWAKKPTIWYFEENIAENFFDSMVKILHDMPTKIKYGEDWYLKFENNKKNKSRIGDKADKSLLRMTGDLCVPTDNGIPQGFILLDSYPMMNPRAQDEKGVADNKMGGPVPMMFSKNIVRIKGLLTEKKIILLGINQFRQKPGVMFGPSEYEAGGEALKINSDSRLKHAAAAIPKEYKNWGTKERAGHATEKSCSGGIDTYRFISVTVEKNKIGGSPKGTKIFQRIWVSDDTGTARGIDPAFDTYQYLILTGQASGNLKKIKIKLKKNPLDGITLDFLQFKTLIIGTTEQKKAVAAKLKLKKNPKLREFCFKQIKSGKAYKIFGGH